MLRFGQIEEGEAAASSARPIVPYPFESGADLLAMCSKTGLSIPRLMMANELAWRAEREIRDGILKIWGVMGKCAAIITGFIQSLETQRKD